jgi:superfamily II DNA or RNA helicase/SAM-dependent methyltransferase
MKAKKQERIFPFQIIGARHIVENRRVLIGDQPGLFKTSQAIFGKSKLEEKLGKVPTLVVCPYSVKKHWEEEIYKWYTKREKSKIVNLTSDNFSEGIKEAKNADFVLIHYNLLSRVKTQKEKERIESLKKLGFRYMIVDEVHNAKNPEAFRSQNVKGIADNAKYLALLSGTPIPNDIEDIYMLMSLLNPEKYNVDFKNPQKNVKNFLSLYKRDPHLVKTLLHEKMLRREIDDYIKLKLPKVEYINLEVKLRGDHANVYDEIYENDEMEMYPKLEQILKASLDPSLVNPKYILNDSLRKKIKLMESDKYKTLDKIIEEETRKGKKVLIFTSHFKDGVTAKLKNRYHEYNAEVIEGDVDDDEREKIRKEFQTNPNKKVLIATIGTMGEGVDLTAADSIVFLDKGYTPKDIDQAIARSNRVGEIKKKHLKIYSLISKNKYPTIDEGIERLIEDKREIIDFMLKGYRFSEDELKELFNTKVYKAKPIAESLMSPRKVIFQYFIFKRNVGSESFKKSTEKNIELAKRIPKIYLTDWQNTIQGNTAEAYKEIINGIEKKVTLKNIVDLASGPFILSRTLNRPVTNVDIDPYMIKEGLETACKGNIAYESPLHKLPLESKKYDLAVCSLAYQMLAVERKDKEKEYIRERESFLKETNRILKKDGYLIVTMPHSMVRPEETQKFYGNLEKLGFKVIKELSGYVEANKVGGDFKIFNAVIQKKNDYSPNLELPGRAFEFRADRKERERREKKEEWVIKRAFYNKFMISDGYGNKAPLEEKIKKYVSKSI